MLGGLNEPATRLSILWDIECKEELKKLACSVSLVPWVRGFIVDPMYVGDIDSD